MNMRWLTGALLPALLIPAGGFAQPQGKPAGQGPVIEIQDTAHDFGEVFKTGQLSHVFMVYNAGDADLLIQDVKPFCGCTAADFDRVIAPGQEGKVELVIDAAKVHGQFDKQATVKSNDPAQPQLILHVSGNAKPYVNVEPEGTVYMHGRSGEAVEQDVTISSNEKDLDFKVLGVRSNIDDKITYEVADGPAPGTYTLKVYKNPRLPTLSTYGSLFIRTNSQKWPDTTVQVHVMTKGSITISPNMLNYGSVKFSDEKGAGTPSTKSLVVTKVGMPFKIKDVTLSNPNYKAVVDEVQPGQQYRVQVTFDPPVQREARHTESGELIIHTDDPKEPAIRVQLLARAQ